MQMAACMGHPPSIWGGLDFTGCQDPQFIYRLIDDGKLFFFAFYRTALADAALRNLVVITGKIGQTYPRLDMTTFILQSFCGHTGVN